MNKKYIIGLVFVVLVIVGFMVFRFMKNDSYEDGGAQKMNMQPSVAPALTDTQKIEQSNALVASTIAKTVEFTVLGGNFYFTPDVMTVKKGDTVKINFKNVDGYHNFVLDEFNATTKTINTGAEDTISFVANKAGTFEYYCSVGSHRAKGMKGILTVIE